MTCILLPPIDRCPTIARASTVSECMAQRDVNNDLRNDMETIAPFDVISALALMTQ